MKFTSLILVLLFSNTLAAESQPDATPSPVVEGLTLFWPSIDATAINVHFSDATYIESLPGDATSWEAPGAGNYYLVATDSGNWQDWSRSITVTVTENQTNAPDPEVLGNRLIWPSVPAIAINVHRANASYVTTLSGEATTWTAPEPGDYYLVAVNDNEWQSWPRSQTVTVTNGDGSLTEQQQIQLPNDCLLTQDATGTAYCFSPVTRSFLAVLTDGSVRYNFPLPGSNDTNRVEGIVSLEIPDTRICIVADLNQSIGNASHELSCFRNNGAFISTVPILDTPQRYGDPVKDAEPVGINLDNESLLITRGNGSVIVAGSHYQLPRGFDSTIRANWTRSSGFIAALDPQTGATLAWHDFPAQQIDSLLGSTSTLYAMINDQMVALDATDTGSKTDNRLSTDTRSFIDQLNRTMPDIISVLHGEQLEVAADYATALTNRLLPDVVFPETPDCDSQDQADCSSIQTSPSLTLECSAGGSANLTTTHKSSFIIGSRDISDEAVWDFSNCALQESNSAIASLEINGRLVIEERERAGPTGFFQTITTRFDDWRVNPQQGTSISITAQFVSLRSSVGRAGTTTNRRTGIIQQLLGGDTYSVKNGYVGRSVQESAGSISVSVSDPGGNNPAFEYFNPDSGLGNVSVNVTTPFSMRYVDFENVISQSSLTGTLRIVSGDESSALIQLRHPPATGGDADRIYVAEQVRYTYEYRGEQQVIIKPSASLYIPWFVTYAQ